MRPVGSFKMCGYQRLDRRLIQGTLVDSLNDALAVDEERARNPSHQISPRCLAPLIEEDGKGQSLAFDVCLDLVGSLCDIDRKDDQFAVTVTFVAGLES